MSAQRFTPEFKQDAVRQITEHCLRTMCRVLGVRRSPSLAAVTDLYSRQIVGRATRSTMTTEPWLRLAMHPSMRVLPREHPATAFLPSPNWRKTSRWRISH